MSLSKPTLEKLHKIFVDNLGDVVSPSHRGAPYPPFNPLKINESNIPDNMRAKFTAIDFQSEKNGEYYLFWETQDDFNSDDFDVFIEEINRCINYQFDYYDIDLSDIDQIILDVEAKSRDGERYGHETKQLIFQKDYILESRNNTDTYYYGFIGGDAGNYFDGDYFTIFRNDDDTFGWIDCEKDYSSNYKKFRTKKEALRDAIKTMKPGDGSKFVYNTNPDVLYNKIIRKQVRYWIEFEDFNGNKKETKLLTEDELLEVIDSYMSNYMIVRVHSTDNDESAKQFI